MQHFKDYSWSVVKITNPLVTGGIKWKSNWIQFKVKDLMMHFLKVRSFFEIGCQDYAPTILSER